MRPHTPTFVLLAALALAGPVLAQGTYGPDRPPGGAGGGMPGGRRGGPGGGPGGMMQGRRTQMLDPVVAEGPPAPADFAKIASPPADQQRRYTDLYQQFMAATKPQRDSLTVGRRDMRAAFEDGDREGARRQRDAVVALGDELTRRQRTFDDTLKSFLGKDQWKRYDKWRSDERKRAEKERQDRWGQGGGGPEPT